MKKRIIGVFLAAIAVCAAVGSAFFINDNDRIPVINGENDIEVNDSYSRLETKMSGWGIKKNKNAPPDLPDNIKSMLPKYDSYYMDTRENKNLYLTFDEGYENGYTAQILDTLKKCNVKAAFFVTKPYLEKETELVKRMIEEGHIVGNHTMNHPDMTTLTTEKIKEELGGLNKIYNELTGADMKYMRPPEGAFSEKVLAVAKDLGYKTIFWSFAYKDWDVKNLKGADYAYNQTIPYLHNGAILLLHAVSKDNADALERIINYAVGEGYTFCSLDELSLEDTQ